MEKSEFWDRLTYEDKVRYQELEKDLKRENCAFRAKNSTTDRRDTAMVALTFIRFEMIVMMKNNSV